MDNKRLQIDIRLANQKAEQRGETLKKKKATIVSLQAEIAVLTETIAGLRDDLANTNNKESNQQPDEQLVDMKKSP